MVIDELIVIENGQQKNVDSADNKTIDVIRFNDGSYHFAKRNQVTNGVCENAVDEPIINMQVRGNSIQATYTGKNLFNSDTSNLQALFYQENKSRWGYDLGVLGVGDYTISFELVDPSIIPEFVYIMIKDETGYLVRFGTLTYENTIGKNPFNFTVTEAQNYYFVFASGTTGTLDDAKKRMAMFKYVQLEKGTSATSYEPYVGVQPSPNPSYPQEVQSVGNRTKNLFDVDYSNLKKVPYSDTIERWGYDIGVLPAGNYNFNFELVDSANVPNSIYLRKKNADGTIGAVGSLTTSVVVNNPLKFTADGETNYYLICASGSVSNVDQAIERMSSFKYIQLELGSTATEYEPYGYKIPLNINGINLVDYTKAIPRNDSQTVIIDKENNRVIWTGDYYFEIPINIPRGLTICLSVDSDKAQVWSVLYEDGTYNEGKKINNYYTPEKNVIAVRIYKFNPTIFEENMVLDNIRVVYGATSNIYLREPLRKIGNYIDYIDYKNKKIVRNVKSFTPNGTEGWITGQGSGYNRYQYLLSDALIGDKSLSLSNMLMWSSGNSKDNSFVIGNSTPYLYIRYDSVADVNEFKEFLENNNLEIVYPLATPTQEGIDISEISTIDGTNIFDVETTIKPSAIVVDYWKQI